MNWMEIFELFDLKNELYQFLNNGYSLKNKIVFPGLASILRECIRFNANEIRQTQFMNISPPPFL
jgi:hypothetical protein